MRLPILPAVALALVFAASVATAAPVSQADACLSYLRIKAAHQEISKASRRYPDDEALSKLVETKGTEVYQAIRVVLAALKNQETKKVVERLFEAQRTAYEASWVAFGWIRLSHPSPNAIRAARALSVAAEAEIAALNALVELACEQ